MGRGDRRQCGWKALLVGMVMMSMLALAGTATAQTVDPHADTTQNCADCHVMHYRLSHDYAGNPAPSLEEGGPFAHLLKSSQSGSSTASDPTVTRERSFDTYMGKLSVTISERSQIVVTNERGLAIARVLHYVDDPVSRSRRLGEPVDAVLLKSGEMLVTDNACNYIDVMTMQGLSLRKVWPADVLRQARAKVQPRCLAVDAKGNTYVSVTGNVNAILALTPDYRLKTKMGEAPGIAGSIFTGIVDLQVDTEGRIRATYAPDGYVQVYSSDGYPINGIRQQGAGPRKLPWSIRR